MNDIYMGHRILDHIQAKVALRATAGVFTIVQPRRGDTVSSGVTTSVAQSLVTNITLSAGTATTMTFPAATLTVNNYIGEAVLVVDDITQPSNIGQIRTIVSNTNQILTIAPELPAVANNTTVVTVFQKALQIPIITSIEVWHTATAGGTLAVDSVGFPLLVSSTANLFAYLPAAAATSGQVQNASMRRIGVVAGDIRGTTAGANMAGTVFVDGFWVGIGATTSQATRFISNG